MLSVKLLSVSDNIVFLTHPVSDFWGIDGVRRTVDYAPLGQKCRVISINDYEWFNTPREVRLFAVKTLYSDLGYIQPADILPHIAGGDFYFAGGNISCCLGNTIKSLYALPGLENKSRLFVLLGDYIWTHSEKRQIISLNQWLAERPGNINCVNSGLCLLREHLTGGSYLVFGRDSLADYGINIFLQYRSHTYTLCSSAGNTLAVNFIVR
ncbi:MAG: hypothetical protein LBD99_01895 [Candidatus Margulisbacteria bacterium]|jgi:hypothetical protein|nr:hypothetical protein [Candidatus Margulisiibacteriota bacterium]